MIEIKFHNLYRYLKHLEVRFPDKEEKIPLRKRPSVVEAYGDTGNLIPSELYELVAETYRKRDLEAYSEYDSATICLDEKVVFSVEMKPADFTLRNQDQVIVKHRLGPKTKVAEAGFIDILMTIDEIIERNKKEEGKR